MYKVIYLGGDVGAEATRESLSSQFEVIHIQSPDELLDKIPNANAILDASMKYRINKELLQNANNLKVISCATTGSDHIDNSELLTRGIFLHTLKEDRELLQNITPAAELSWALLMACSRKINAAIKHVQDGLWQRELFPSIMLNGKTLGLVGFGRIGGWMARYANAFGMKVLVYDPYQEVFPEYVYKVDLIELAQMSDFISVHVHLSDETEKLISSDIFNEMKRGVIIINTSRGAIIDEDVLLSKLQNGHVSAAGLDVLDGEPDIKNHPLVNYAKIHDNLLITPHYGGFSPDAVKVVCIRAAQKIANYF